MWHRDDHANILSVIRYADDGRKMLTLVDKTGSGHFIRAQDSTGTETFNVGVTGAITGASLTLSGLSAGVLHADASGNITSSCVSLTTDVCGLLPNANLANASVTVTAGTGLSGGGSVALGSSVTLNNTGVLTFNSRSGGVSPASGDYTAAQVTNAVDQTGSYNNPSWLTALAGSKITGSVPGNLKWAAAVPSSHTSPGTAGDIAYDGAGNLYVCFFANSWAKFAPSSTTF